MSTDEFGYLTLDTLALTGRQADGVCRSIFRREYLESALWAYGEDACLEAVRAGLSAAQVYEIGCCGLPTDLHGRPRQVITSGLRL